MKRTLPAGELRRMAKQLGLDVDPEIMAGRGQVPAAADEFWRASNVALSEAAVRQDSHRRSQLYHAQARIMHAEGKPFDRVLREANRLDLEEGSQLAEAGVPVEAIVFPCPCDTCASKDLSPRPYGDELRAPRLPHLDCERGVDVCSYGVQAARSSAKTGDAEGPDPEGPVVTESKPSGCLASASAVAVGILTIGGALISPHRR